MSAIFEAREIFIQGDSGKTFEFLTNMLEAVAPEIAEIYKKRRQVEVFFDNGMFASF